MSKCVLEGSANHFTSIDAEFLNVELDVMELPTSFDGDRELHGRVSTYVDSRGFIVDNQVEGFWWSSTQVMYTSRHEFRLAIRHFLARIGVIISHPVHLDGEYFIEPHKVRKQEGWSNLYHYYMPNDEDEDDAL